MIAERQSQLVQLYERSAIKHTLGTRLSYEQQTAVVVLPYKPDYDNAMGTTHGGVLATLLDTAGWFAAAQHYDTWISTADLHVRLLESPSHTMLRATGELLRQGRRLAVSQMAVYDAQGRLVATGSGSYMVSSRPFG